MRAGAGRDDGARDLTPLLLDPHVVEANTLRLLVEALRGVPDGAQPEEIAVADHRDLLVELSGLLRPERHTLLRHGLARQLGLEPQDVLVRGLSRPARGEQVGVERAVEAPNSGA